MVERLQTDLGMARRNHGQARSPDRAHTKLGVIANPAKASRIGACAPMIEDDRRDEFNVNVAFVSRGLSIEIAVARAY